MLELAMKKREIFGKALAASRGEGKLPIVVYGGKKETTSYFVSTDDFKRVLKEAGESTMVSLTGDGESHDALIHDVAVHSVTGEPLHADFYLVDANKPVEVAVDLEFVGESPAVKSLGGVLIKVLHQIHIKVLPRHLVQSIEVNIDALSEIGSRINAQDIKLPESAELLTDAEEVVVLTEEPKEEEEEPAEIDLDSIEVEKKGKEEAPEADAAESK